MQLDKILNPYKFEDKNKDIIDNRCFAPKEFNLPKVVWGMILEFLTVKEECRFRQCAPWTNYLLKTIGKSGFLSDKKIRSLFFVIFNKETVFRKSDSQYVQTWCNRILHISTGDLPSGFLNKDIFFNFPNLISLRILSNDTLSFFKNDSKLFSKTLNQGNSEIDRKITLIFEKYALYLLGKKRLDYLFELFPFCTNIQFIPTWPGQIEKISLCKRWGLVPEKIYNMFKEISFIRNEKISIEQLKKMITNEKLKNQHMEREIVKETTSTNCFLYNYFGLETGVKKGGINSLDAKALFDCESKAIQEGNVIAMYNRFVHDNKLPRALTSLTEQERSYKDHYSSLPIDRTNKNDLLNYHLLEEAVTKKFPPAQFLFAIIEMANDISLRNRSFGDNPLVYLRYAAQAEYPPACAEKMYEKSFKKREGEFSEENGEKKPKN